MIKIVDNGMVDSGDDWTTASVKSIVDNGAEETSIVDSGMVLNGDAPMVRSGSRTPKAAMRSPSPCVVSSRPSPAQLVAASAPAS